MVSRSSLSKTQLLELLQRTESQLATKDSELATKDSELATKDSELATKDSELATKSDIITQLEQKNLAWEQAYNKLWHERFAARSERYILDSKQLQLDFGDTDEAADAADGLGDAVEEADLIPEHKRRKPKKKRDESLPADLPRYEVTAPVAADLTNCATHGPKSPLPESMWDRTETLEFEPPRLKVRVTIHPKYACDNHPECGIASPERPTSIVEGDKYDASIAAEIITGKFGYHLPIYRQQDYFAGSGWIPSRSTLLNILTNAHFVIEPLLAFFKLTVQGDPIVGCDDTSVTLLYPKTVPTFDLNDPKQRRIHEVFTTAANENKPSIRAKMWAYRGQTIPLNVFDFTVSRHRDGPDLFFANYNGVLLGDCWHGFKSIALESSGAIVRAACNSHARRKIHESAAYPSERAVWLGWYQELYDIEDRAAVMSAEERLVLRQSEAQPIWDKIESWLKSAPLRTTNVILPKSDFGKALQYIRNHFAELTLYLTNPLIPLDNNETEQLMKQVAIGRKNWLFSGSVAAGERSAGFMTLVSSALRNDLNVWNYVKDVLTQLLSGRTDYEPLLPWNWAAAHPESIRQYRAKERRERTDRKRNNRAARRNR